jgi:ABC-type enterobactin transport system permease subunit
MSKNADAVISNIRIRKIRLSLLGIHICIYAVIAVIKCGYYPLSVSKVISVLDYYLDLYARLNNVVITICKNGNAYPYNFFVGFGR